MTNGQICLVVKNLKASITEPVGRRERKRLETRDKLFQAAVQLFAKQGFAATKVEDITEAADVAKGTFFNYFPSKEHVLMYFAGRQIEKVEACLRAAEEGDTPIDRLLKTMAHELVTLPTRTPELARSMMSSFMSNEQVRHMVREEIAGRARNTLAQVLDIGQKRGEIKQDLSAYELARGFQQTMFGTVLMWSLNPEESIGGILDTTLSMLWTGMCANGKVHKKKR
jgi:AcrR family transcriptional regulator